MRMGDEEGQLPVKVAKFESPMNVNTDTAFSDITLSDPPAGAPGGASSSNSGAWCGASSGSASSGPPGTGTAG
eukprot:7199901-Pyramimonas_sp.AAC.1